MFRGNLAVSVANLRSDFSVVQKSQEALKDRVKILEDRSTHDEDAFFLAPASVTLANYCKPYDVVISNFPVIPEDLTADALSHIGSLIDVKFLPAYVTKFWRALLPALLPRPYPRARQLPFLCLDLLTSSRDSSMRGCGNFFLRKCAIKRAVQL